MNIAANQAIYPQTATHLPYPNGAIIQSPIQQTASIVRIKFVFVCFILRQFYLGILSSYGTNWSDPINLII